MSSSSSSSSSSSQSKNEISDNVSSEAQIKNKNSPHSPPNPIIQDDNLDLSENTCNILVSQIFQFNLLKGDVCKYCGLSPHLHAQSIAQIQPPSQQPSKISSSKSSLDKNVIASLPKWKKDHKVCNTFFNSLEQLFNIHNVTDESLFKKYLHLTLDELSESDKTYTFNNIINTAISWSRTKELFAQRFEAYDYVNKLRKQYNDMKYSSHDNIQSFSNRYINSCNELSYDTTSAPVIHRFLSLLPPDIHRRFLMRIESQDKEVSDFDSLQDIVDQIIRIENAYNNAAYISSSHGDHNPNHDNNHKAGYNNNHYKNKQSPIKRCIYHPNSANHTTTECRTGHNNNHNNHGYNNNNKNNNNKFVTPTSSPHKPGSYHASLSSSKHY
jgi:hypothetical protein